MKRIVLILFALVFCMASYTQTISINALVADEKIPEEAASQLENRLRTALTENGYGDNGYTERFVLTAKVDVTQKDVMPTTPTRISEKMDITLMVGDVINNKLYASVTLQTSGIGTNENKAFISAFRTIKGDNPKIQQMLNDAKKKIFNYYTNHCEEVRKRVDGLVAMQKYEEAIFMLNTVPNINKGCFTECQQQLGVVYQTKIDADAENLLEKAKTIWAASPNYQGAKEVYGVICQINPKCSSYSEVLALRSTIEAKLKADEKREWSFKIHQYEDSQAFKRSLVDAGRAIGVAWAKNQPKSIVKTIIRSWW